MKRLLFVVFLFNYDEKYIKTPDFLLKSQVFLHVYSVCRMRSIRICMFSQSVMTARQLTK